MRRAATSLRVVVVIAVDGEDAEGAVSPLIAARCGRISGTFEVARSPPWMTTSAPSVPRRANAAASAAGERNGPAWTSDRNRSVVPSNAAGRRAIGISADATVR